MPRQALPAEPTEEELLAYPVPPWDGTVCLLLGTPIEPRRPAAADSVAAYRAACQQLAWDIGRLWTWAAALSRCVWGVGGSGWGCGGGWVGRWVV